jgi:hypothetical protein
MQALYEISFVGGDGLHQFRTRMDEDTSNRLQKAIYTDTDRLAVSDVQVYLISEDANETSACEMVQILEDNTFDNEQALPALRKLAEKVDQSAQKPGAQKEIFLIEYVWDNGGGDDNAFAQNVCVNKKSRATNQAFFDALEAYLEYRSYDFVATPLSMVAERELSFREALEGTRDALISLGQPTTRFNAIWEAMELQEKTAPAPRRRTGPRL